MNVTDLWYFEKTGSKSIVRAAEEIFPADIQVGGYQTQTSNRHINPLSGNFRIREMRLQDLHVICDWQWRILLEWKPLEVSAYCSSCACESNVHTATGLHVPHSGNLTKFQLNSTLREYKKFM
jgi:hypothetical protein